MEIFTDVYTWKNSYLMEVLELFPLFMYKTYDLNHIGLKTFCLSYLSELS